MNKEKNKNEFEGYFVLEFNSLVKTNAFLINYHVYEQYWMRKHVYGLLPNIKEDWEQFFDEFEFIIMKKEPSQISVTYLENNKIIIKLWIVCKLQEKYFETNQENNKAFIINKINDLFINPFNQEYRCKTHLQYLDVAADNVEE